MGRWIARAGQELLIEADWLVPFRCIGGGRGTAVTTSPARWRVRSRGRAASRSEGTCCGASGRPSSRSDCRGRKRARNVQGAFKVSADRHSEVQGRRVVLIDDVLTSGATIDACARALLRAKAATVDVLVFARVVDTHRPPI